MRRQGVHGHGRVRGGGACGICPCTTRGGVVGVPGRLRPLRNAAYKGYPESGATAVVLVGTCPCSGLLRCFQLALEGGLFLVNERQAEVCAPRPRVVHNTPQGLLGAQGGRDTRPCGLVSWIATCFVDRQRNPAICLIVSRQRCFIAGAFERHDHATYKKKTGIPGWFALTKEQVTEADVRNRSTPDL